MLRKKAGLVVDRSVASVATSRAVVSSPRDSENAEVADKALDVQALAVEVAPDLLAGPHRQVLEIAEGIVRQRWQGVLEYTLTDRRPCLNTADEQEPASTEHRGAGRNALA
jgi:hypothetical protein